MCYIDETKKNLSENKTEYKADYKREAEELIYKIRGHIKSLQRLEEENKEMLPKPQCFEVSRILAEGIKEISKIEKMFSKKFNVK